jgi:hypothetical protein
MSRQVMQHLIGDKLPVIKTEKNEVLGSRAYTPEQIKNYSSFYRLQYCNFVDNEYLCQLSLLVHLVYIALHT